MNENKARYIVRMIETFKSNTLFLDATNADYKEHNRMKKRYQETGGWDKGSETALIEFIMRVDKNGVPGGEYLREDTENLEFCLSQRRIPLIERPAKSDA